MDRVANAKERKELWTAVMRDPAMDVSVRLRASELLGKSEGDFVDRRQIEGGDEPVRISRTCDVAIEDRVATLIEDVNLEMLG